MRHTGSRNRSDTIFICRIKAENCVAFLRFGCLLWIVAPDCAVRRLFGRSVIEGCGLGLFRDFENREVDRSVGAVFGKVWK